MSGAGFLHEVCFEVGSRTCRATVSLPDSGGRADLTLRFEPSISRRQWQAMPDADRLALVNELVKINRAVEDRATLGDAFYITAPDNPFGPPEWDDAAISETAVAFAKLADEPDAPQDAITRRAWVEGRSFEISVKCATPPDAARRIAVEAGRIAVTGSLEPMGRA